MLHVKNLFLSSEAAPRSEDQRTQSDFLIWFLCQICQNKSAGYLWENRGSKCMWFRDVSSPQICKVWPVSFIFYFNFEFDVIEKVDLSYKNQISSFSWKIWRTLVVGLTLPLLYLFIFHLKITYWVPTVCQALFHRFIFFNNAIII